MIELFFKGLLIGVISSAPMGAVGILCIQRTLNKGRWHGFATGMGAVFSDLFYAIITGLGMGFFIEFINEHLYSMQLLGSVALLFLGGYIFSKKPFNGYRKSPSVQATHLIREFTTGFVFTVSNVLIIFLFIALFAHLRFITPRNDVVSYLAGYGGIFIGAAGWWFLVTLLFDKLRGKITFTQLRFINRATGCIICLLSLAGIVSSLLERGFVIG